MKIALMGTGRHGPHYLQRFRGAYGTDMSNMVDDIAIVDINHTRLYETGNEFDIEKRYDSADNMLDEFEPDAAIIAVTPTATFEASKPFLERRIPTLIEKPLSYTIEDAKKIKNLADESGTLVACGYQMIHIPSYSDAVEFIQERGLKPRDVSVRWVKNRGLRTHVIGDVITEDSHPFGFVSHLLGKPDSVISFGKYMLINIDIDKWEVENIGTDKQSHSLHLDPVNNITSNYGEKVRNQALIMGRAITSMDFSEGFAHVESSFESGQNIREIDIQVIDPEIYGSTNPSHYGSMYTLRIGLNNNHETGDIPFLKIIGETVGELGKDIATRKGTGKVIVNQVYEENYDELGMQTGLFLNSAQEGILSHRLCDLNSALATQEIIEAAYKSLITKKKIDL